MVVPLAAAAQAAGAAGSAGATALGLKMGKTDLDLTRDLFKQQMRQAKRLWTADWAEASVRHGEQCLQAAQQHAEAQAMATTTYFQAEKIAAQSFKLARDQDCRGYEMSWRAEVRESLRDELANQNNRFNIIMLCDTVCLSCVFTLLADGNPPVETSSAWLIVYVFSLGLSVTLFSVSLWCAVIVERRLHENTASTLERKLFLQSDDLQKVWQHQLENNQPTGPHEIHLVNQAYERWVAEYIEPIGNCSIHLLSIGVVAMFFTAGVLMHVQYINEYNAQIPSIIFWCTVFVTSATVIVMKHREDFMERGKVGIYDISWQDKTNVDTGPFAKISKAARELFSNTAVGLGSVERMENMGNREKNERGLCVKTQSLHHRVKSFQQEMEKREKVREEILQILTSAAEELDALPEELISRLNKILHDIDEADRTTASLVAMQSDGMIESEERSRNSDWSRLRRLQPRATMAPDPIDAQRIPVSLGSLRRKLGEISLTTLLRLRNLSDEPLRLKSGVQLTDGKYIKSLNTRDKDGNAACYHLYPVSEIPPRTEVVIAARSSTPWVGTSGILGEIAYTNRNQSWEFRISFRNERRISMRQSRQCQVKATMLVEKAKNEAEPNPYWQIERDEIDRKANNEVVVSIDVRRGGEALKAALSHRQSQRILKSGYLLKNRSFGLRMQWQQRWFVLYPQELIYSHDIEGTRRNAISIKDIIYVRPLADDLVNKNVFEIHAVSADGTSREPYKLSAASPADRDEWIQKILSVADKDIKESDIDIVTSEDTEASCECAIECIQSDGGTTEVLSEEV